MDPEYVEVELESNRSFQTNDRIHDSVPSYEPSALPLSAPEYPSVVQPHLSDLMQAHLR